MMKEPSVLDYLKSKLLFWCSESIEIPALTDDTFPGDEFLDSVAEMPLTDFVGVDVGTDNAGVDLMRWSGWWVIPVLVLALLAQRFLVCSRNLLE